MSRPKIHHTPEALKAAQAAWRKSAKAKTKNISLDGDLVEALNHISDRLIDKFGFRPTHSQCVRYLINKEKERCGDLRI